MEGTGTNADGLMVFPPEPWSTVVFGIVLNPETGKKKKRGKTYIWVPCNVCGQVVLTNRWGSPCRLTPRCSGRYARRPSVSETDRTDG